MFQFHSSAPTVTEYGGHIIFINLGLIGSNKEIGISVIKTSDVICCIDVPLIITISLAIDKHINPSRDSISVDHECKTHMGICDWEMNCAVYGDNINIFD